MKTKTQSFTDQYRAAVADTIVDVHLPSGMTFQMVKPSKYDMLFRLAALPQGSTAQAVEAWEKAGVFEPSDSAPEQDVDPIDHAKRVTRRIIELSRYPRIVAGEASKDDELSIFDLSDGDFEHLAQWLVSGGRVSDELTTFPEKSGTDALASASRRKVRGASKSAGRAPSTV